jgi:LAO/AO transport system kinase
MSPAPVPGTSELVEGVFARDFRRIGQAISAAESGAGVPELSRRIYPKSGRARVVGLTGPPGAGTSSLALKIALAYRGGGRTVGVVAVDPSSPFTGGAILGDRIRMSEIYTDPGVFIRSMATRGTMGGLARATSDAVDILDAAGFDVVIVETVGVGQDEVDIIRTAQTVAVVLVPGLGDDIQAIKAGILEIADVFVVNKADREGADRTQSELAMMLDLTPNRGWRPPIVRTVAPRGEGVPAVLEAIDSHGSWLASSPEGRIRETRRARARLLALLEERFHRTIESRSSPQRGGLEDAIARVRERSEDPYSAAERLFESLVREPAGDPA